jgi:hypothetical protein
MNNRRIHIKMLLLLILFWGSGMFFLVLAIVVVFHNNSQSDALPANSSYLVFSPTSVRFDGVSQGTVQGKVTVTNTSNKPVSIDSIKKGCDCTQVQILQGILEPGKNRDISFQWDTRGRRGEDQTTIEVVYSIAGDPQKHIAPLVLSAMVIPDFDIVPKKLTFFLQIQPNPRIARLFLLDSRI